MELNWLYKLMKKVRSSQPAILVLNWIEHSYFLWVLLIFLPPPRPPTPHHPHPPPKKKKASEDDKNLTQFNHAYTKLNFSLLCSNSMMQELLTWKHQQKIMKFNKLNLPKIGKLYTSFFTRKHMEVWVITWQLIFLAVSTI